MFAILNTTKLDYKRMMIEIRHIDSVMNVDIRVAMAISLTVIILRWDHVHLFWFLKIKMLL